MEVNTTGPNPSFTLILEDDSGNLWRKKYVFNGYRVNKVDVAPYALPRKEPVPAVAQTESKPAQPLPTSWYAGMKQKISRFFHR